MPYPTSLPADYVAIDTETTGLSTYAGHRMFSAAAAWPNGDRKFWYRDELKHKDFRRLCENPAVDKVFHNAKFDLKMIEAHGIQVKGQVWDTMIFGHLLDSNQSLSLDNMSKRYLPSDKRKVVDEITNWFAENMGKRHKAEYYQHFSDLPIDILRKRNVGDADLTLMLFMRLYSTVATVFPRLLEQEHRLLHVVKRMEDRGLMIDVPEIDVQDRQMDKILEDVQDFCEGMVGRDDFNINSRADLVEILKIANVYGQLKERTAPTKRFPEGQPKLDSFNLRQLHHPAPLMILLGKGAAKLKANFLAQLRTANVNGVVHPNYNQLGTTTGRFSCSNPNLQNVPTENVGRMHGSPEELAEEEDMTGTKYYQHIKHIFMVRPGYVHIHADKKQAEMFMLGHYSGDPLIIDMLNKSLATGGSVHDEMCQHLFGKITKLLRNRTKDGIFGYLYGAGAKRLSTKLRFSIQEAQDFKNLLTTRFPSLASLNRRLGSEIAGRGYVETVHGRRHYLARDESYKAVNRLCQGSIGDEVKNRMLALDDYFASRGREATVLLNIHDDIASEVPGDDPEKMKSYMRDIKRIMEQLSVQLLVPLPSSLDITYTRWSELKEIKDVENPPTRETKIGEQK